MTKERIREIRESNLVTYHVTTVFKCLDEIEKLRALVEEASQFVMYVSDSKWATDSWQERAKEVLK